MYGVWGRGAKICRFETVSGLFAKRNLFAGIFSTKDFTVD